MPNSYTFPQALPGRESIRAAKSIFALPRARERSTKSSSIWFAANSPNLQAGVYHFAPAEFGLRRLRAGDYRSVLVEATGGEPAIAHAPLTIVCTCTYWRNAWKYQARTYRHFGWDNGTMLANLLAVATALGLPAKVVCGFVDATVNRLLDVDSQREVAFSLVALGHDSALSGQTAPPSQTISRTLAEISPLGFETVPLSRDEVDYPLMREMHAASSLDSAEEVAAWRGRTAPDTVMPSSPPPAGPVVRLQPLSDGEMPRDPIEQVILRRGSSRQVCAHADQPGAALHHAGPGYARSAG